MNRSIDYPLVSVILPVYNGELYLDFALQSIFEQEYDPFEVIVVDDGSTDNSADIARSYKDVRYIYQPNQGVASARNSGISMVRGEFIAFLDQDDLWTSNKLRIQVEYLLKNPDVGYVISKVKTFLEPGTELPQGITKVHLMTDTAILIIGSLVARKDIFERVGYFDTSYHLADDLDWFFRSKEAGITMAIVPEILLKRRLHSSNLSYNMKKVSSEFARALKLSIERKRK